MTENRYSRALWMPGVVALLAAGALPSRPSGATLLAGLACTMALTALARTGASYAFLLSLNGLFVEGSPLERMKRYLLLPARGHAGAGWAG